MIEIWAVWSLVFFDSAWSTALTPSQKLPNINPITIRNLINLRSIRQIIIYNKHNLFLKLNQIIKLHQFYFRFIITYLIFNRSPIIIPKINWIFLYNI